MTISLREPLNPDQTRLIETIYEPFRDSAEWPIWQYVDLTLDAKWDLDAATVLASLPLARHPNPAMWSSTYGLAWYMNPNSQPQADQPVALTVAGLHFISQAEPLVGAFLATVMYLIDEQRRVIPRPDEVVEATVSSDAIEEQLLTASIEMGSAPPLDVTLAKVRQLLEHEPILWSTVQMGNAVDGQWSVRIPAA